jgi:hypothetical protein
VAKVQVEDKGFIQIKVSAWGASNVKEDLQNFANGDENGGGLYELMVSASTTIIISS